ncbi:M56 family metallopeptidase [Nocardioides pyridinolyticus]
MLMAGAFLIYAACVGWLGDRILARVSLRIGSPAAALWVWHGLALTVLTALGIGLAMASHDVWEHSLSWLLHADKSRVHAAYAGPGEVPTAWNLALVVLLALAAPAGVTAVNNLRGMKRAAASHGLLSVATPGTLSESQRDVTGVAVVPESTPLIYCLPGRASSRRIVVTTGARELLSEDQLEAALDHERAHLARRHHLMVLAAEVVAAALRWPRLLQRYPGVVRLLVELDADEYAARRHGKRTVATALLEISCADSSTRPVGLAMSGTGTTLRIRRLLDPQRHAPHRAVAALLLPGAMVLAAAPTIVAAIPAVDLVGSAHSPKKDESPGVGGSSDVFIHHP